MCFRFHSLLGLSSNLKIYLGRCCHFNLWIVWCLYRRSNTLRIWQPSGRPHRSWKASDLNSIVRTKIFEASSLISRRRWRLDRRRPCRRSRIRSRTSRNSWMWKRGERPFKQRNNIFRWWCRKLFCGGTDWDREEEFWEVFEKNVSNIFRIYRLGSQLNKCARAPRGDNEMEQNFI